MTKLISLAEKIETELGAMQTSVAIASNEITIECEVAHIISLLTQLKNHESFAFDQLIDLCAVDYLLYGEYDWKTDAASEDGFSRAVDPGNERVCPPARPRFAVVYHLLSTTLNQRVRVKVFVAEPHLVIPSANEIWKAANWFEREAYDLYGILFENHPDLRRILTDYGFIGHPFRKDFPLGGHVEMRYDASYQKVVYEPVDLEPRVTVPKVIRRDNRYCDNTEGK